MAKLLKEVTYQGSKYYVFQASYHNGKPAIILHPDDEFYQSPDQIVVSVNLDETEQDEVAISDHDYYEGQFEFLVNEGIIKYTGRFIPSGFVVYPVGKLSI